MHIDSGIYQLLYQPALLSSDRRIFTPRECAVPTQQVNECYPQFLSHWSLSCAATGMLVLLGTQWVVINAQERQRLERTASGDEKFIRYAYHQLTVYKAWAHCSPSLVIFSFLSLRRFTCFVPRWR
jgi:hypothetical protein